MASIRKRGNQWQARVSVKVNGKYKEKSKGGFKTRAQANSWAKLQESDKVTGTIIAPKQQTYPEYFREWIDIYRSDATLSAKRWYAFCANVFDEYLGNVQLSALTRPMLQNFLNDISKKYAFATVKKIKTYLSQSIRTAHYDDLIAKDPTQGLTYTGKSGKDKELKFLEEPQMKSLIYEIENKPLSERSASDMMILSALYTGARYEELAGLTLADIINDKDISINKAWDQVDKIIKPTKTKSSNRIVSVPTGLTLELRTWINTNDRNSFIFVQPDSDLPITSAAVNKQLKRLLKKIKSPKIITLHGLRHTHASWLISNGVDIHYVSERLGHSSISITLEVYTHMLDRTRQAESDKSMNLLSQL